MVLGGMSDGRMFTDYRSSCTINNEIKKENNLNDNTYRKFLQSKTYLENKSKI